MSQPGSGNRGAIADSQRLRAATLTAVQHLGPGTSDTAYHSVLFGVVLGVLLGALLGALFGRAVLAGVAAGGRDPKPQILIMRNVNLPALRIMCCLPKANRRATENVASD
jgi:hypothetical protein